MHPVLIDIGALEIRSYGFMLAVSFLFGIYLAGYRARKFGMNPQYILDLSVYIILAAVVGSRLLYVAFHLEEFNSPLEIFALWRGGATFYGGMLLAMWVSWVYVRRKRIAFLQVADVMAPSIGLGLLFTRVGCFLSGCCYGKPTEHAIGVFFPAVSPAGYSAADHAVRLGVERVALHPTQLYSSGYGLIIFVILMVLSPRLAAKRGATFGALLVLYGTARFSVDFFRYYEESARVLFGLTFNQVISVVLFGIGVWLLTRRLSTGRADESGEAGA